MLEKKNKLDGNRVKVIQVINGAPKSSIGMIGIWQTCRPQKNNNIISGDIEFDIAPSGHFIRRWSYDSTEVELINKKSIESDDKCTCGGPSIITGFLTTYEVCRVCHLEK